MHNLQTMTTKLSSEAEFNALSYVMKGLKWLLSGVSEIGIPKNHPAVFLQDSLGSIPWTDDMQVLRPMTFHN